MRRMVSVSWKKTAKENRELLNKASDANYYCHRGHSTVFQSLSNWPSEKVIQKS